MGRCGAPSGASKMAVAPAVAPAARGKRAPSTGQSRKGQRGSEEEEEPFLLSLLSLMFFLEGKGGRREADLGGAREATRGGAGPRVVLLPPLPLPVLLAGEDEDDGGPGLFCLFCFCCFCRCWCCLSLRTHSPPSGCC